MWNRLKTFFTGDEVTDSRRTVHVIKRVIWMFLWLDLFRYGVGILQILLKGNVADALSMLIMPAVILFLLFFITF